jgi:hypothetical protein
MYMRTHPDFQVRNTELPTPKIAVGGDAPFSCPSLNGLRVKTPKDDSSGGAVEERLNGLKRVRCSS